MARHRHHLRAVLKRTHTVPLGTDGANSLSGIRYAASTSLSHAPVRASCIWLVEAIVLSHTCAPHSA